MYHLTENKTILMKPIYLLLIVVGSLTTLSSCSDSEGKGLENKTQPIPVRTITLKKETISLPIEASGQFTTGDETYLSFKTGGIISKTLKKEGDVVRKGELLATLDLTEIDAQVAQARLAHEKAKRDLERVTNLYRDSVTTLEQYQNARTGMELSSRQLDAALFNRSYSEIRAVSDGYVLRKLANPGQVIGPGSPVFQTNGAIQQGWNLKVSVSDRSWAQIAIGDQATVKVDTYAESLNATVVRKSEGTDPYTGLLTIELALHNPPKGVIASGLFGKAIINPSASEDAWAVPYDALLDGDTEYGYVFVTDDNQTATKRQVTISQVMENHALVSHGLDDVTSLIVIGSAYLKDGSPISIIN
jgi:RND family efflux transporter MFP subunit